MFDKESFSDYFHLALTNTHTRTPCIADNALSRAIINLKGFKLNKEHDIHHEEEQKPTIKIKCKAKCVTAILKMEHNLRMNIS